MDRNRERDQLAPRPTMEFMWQKWLKQMLFTTAYFLLGVLLAARGACFLDLMDLYQSTETLMTYTLLVFGVGATIGCAFLGLLQDRWPNHSLMILSVAFFMLAISNGLLAHGQSMVILFLLSFLAGFGLSSCMPLIRLALLNTWRETKFKVGPFIHSLYVMQSLGYVVAPLVAKPFLSSGDKENTNEEHRESRVTLLFPLLGLAALTVSLCFLAASLAFEFRCRRKDEENTDDRKKEDGEQERCMSWPQLVIAAVVLLCFFLDYALQMCLANFIIVTLSTGPLEVSKSEGANIQALYSLGQLASRLLAIFISIILSPNAVLLIILPSALVCSCGLAFWPWPSLMLTQTLFTGLGAALGSLLGTSLLWLEQFMKLTGVVSGLASTAAASSFIVGMLVFGTLVELVPQLLLYVQVGVVATEILAIATGTFVGYVMILRKKEEQKETKINEAFEMNERTIQNGN